MGVVGTRSGSAAGSAISAIDEPEDEEMSKTKDPSPSTCVISGLTVSFPFDPYACQVVYMERIIQALRQVGARVDVKTHELET